MRKLSTLVVLVLIVFVACGQASTSSGPSNNDVAQQMRKNIQGREDVQLKNTPFDMHVLNDL